uniref:methyl-accepting chemotaxis protein n=1 Tax=Noviherbaspirillum sp. TaxID=1926288 RepID=UPI002FE0B73E
MKFSNLKIGTRLGITFGFIALLTVMLGGFSYSEFSTIENSWNGYRTLAKPKLDITNQAGESLGQGIQHFKNFIMRGKDYEQRFHAEMTNIDAAMTAYEKLGSLAAVEKAEIEKVRSGIAAYREAIGKAAEMKATGAGIAEIDSAIKGADQAIKSALGKLEAIAEEQIKETSVIVNREIANGERMAAIASTLTVLLTVVFAWITTRSITAPIARAVNATRVVASGDLTQNIEADSADETGDLLRALGQMNASLARIVGDVRAGTDAIKTSSGEIAAGNQDLSSRTEQQASSLEETASSMEELTSTVKQNADNARQANQLAVSASEVAVRGGAVVSDVVSTMSAINESARKIVDIIGVIDGIAFQTNI